MTRCMKDKIPEGQYVIRAGVLDRLIENKLYYKFIEHGIKEQELKEVEKENKKEIEATQAKKDGQEVFGIGPSKTGINFDTESQGEGDSEGSSNTDDEHNPNEGQESDSLDLNESNRSKKNLFDDSEDDDSDEEGGKKGVKFAIAKTMKQKKTMMKKKTTMKSKMNMDAQARQSKIGFARSDIDDRYDEDNKPEKVWLDFGK